MKLAEIKKMDTKHNLPQNAFPSAESFYITRENDGRGLIQLELT